MGKTVTNFWLTQKYKIFEIRGTGWPDKKYTYFWKILAEIENKNEIVGHIDNYSSFFRQL